MSRVSALAACAGLGLAAFAAPAQHAAPEPPRPAVQGLDHVVVAVADLERACRTFRALGFTLKDGRAHPSGIRNRHAKFFDGTEIELLSVRHPLDSLATEYAQLIAAGDGGAFVALYAPEPDALEALLRDAQIAYRRDPSTLTFPQGSRLRHIFFGRRNKSPTDKPEHYSHANTALWLTGVELAAGDYAAERALFEAVGLVPSAGAGAAEYALGPGAEAKVKLLPSSKQVLPGRRVRGVTLAVWSVEEAVPHLTQNGIRYSMPQKDTGRRLSIPPPAANGIWIHLEKSTTAIRPRQSDP